MKLKIRELCAAVLALLTAFGGGAGADWGGHPGGLGGSGGGSTLSDSSGLTDASAPNGVHVYRLR